MDNDKKYICVEIDGKKVRLEVNSDGTYRKCDEESAFTRAESEQSGNEEFYQSPSETKEKNENKKHKFKFFKREKNAWEFFPTTSFCILLYLCLGFIWNLWHPGWIVFLLVPMVVSILEDGLKGFPYPIFVVAVYLCLGFIWNLWHPGWLIFFTIPIYYAILSGKSFRAFMHAMYPLFTVIVYLVLGFTWNLWHPGWLVFLSIPVFNGFAEMVRHSKNK